MKFSDTIGIIPDVLNKEECQELINLFENYNKIGKTYNGSTLGGIESAKKSTDYNLLNDSEDNQKYINLVANAFNKANVDWFENFPHNDLFSHRRTIDGSTYYPLLQMQKYDKNEGHFNGWHLEKQDFNTTHRYLVFILYLNDVDGGGETEFLFKEEGAKDFFKVKPKTGTLIIHPASWPYIHKGNIPTSDNKYILTTWLCYRD
tara:strand:- start:54 stop:665 length:612 start_codon:yes stop_codon:yes gene_type:complete